MTHIPRWISFCFYIFVGWVSVLCLFFALNNLKSCDWKNTVFHPFCVFNNAVYTDNFSSKIPEN